MSESPVARTLASAGIPVTKIGRSETIASSLRNATCTCGFCASSRTGNLHPLMPLRLKPGVYSSDPVTDVEIHVLLHADGRGTWEPNEAVVVSGRACEGAAFRERYLRERDAVRGEVISLPQAIEAGRCIFGDILRTS